MVKKKKNPEIITTTNASSTVFDTLFGSLPVNETSASIFSDQNPFKRTTPNEDNVKEQTGLGLETPKKAEKKRKKDNLESGSVSKNEILDTLLVDKKSKKKKESGNGDLSTKSEKLEVKNDEKDEKKRKKDKIESGSVLNDDILDIKKSKKKKESGYIDLSTKLEKLEVKNDENVAKTEKIESGSVRKDELLDVKRSKKKESGNVNFSTKLNNDENVTKMETKREKKRKREDVETEYEAMKYGVVERELGGKSVGEKRKKDDEKLEMVPVSKDGFDDEAKLLRTVFVGNLPVKVKKKGLFAEFRQFGDVESVRIRSVPLLDTKIPRKGAIIQKKINDAVDSVHAYIVFKTEEAAQAALAHNMAVVGGKHIRVDRACPPRKKLKGDDNAPLYDNKRTVFVGNLPFDVKDEEVYQLFSGIKDLDPTSIEGIRVIRDPGSSLGKGIAYVLFKTRVDANLVARKHGLKLRDRELRISHSKTNVTPTKRKEPPSEERSDSRAKKLTSNPDSNSKYKFNTSSSYQGLRATKSGVEKKTSRPKSNEPVKFKSKAQSGTKVKERTGKRPTVAARKAKAVNKGDGSGSNKTGFKRKMGNRTPTSAQGRPNKKAKKF